MERPRRLLVISGEGFYGRQIMSGIHAYCRTRGLWEYHSEIDKGADTVEHCMFAIKQWKADAIIAQVRTRQVERLVRRSGLPVVNCSAMFECEMPTVVNDNIAAGKMAAGHLLENGVRSFAFCALTSEMYTHKYFQGFTASLAEAGFGCEAFRDYCDSESEVDWVANRKRMQKWLRSLKKPIAILCVHGPRGLEVCQACRRLGISIPDEVAVIALDNDELLCQMCNPPLSSVDLDARRIGYESVRLIDRMLRGRKPPAVPILIAPRRVIPRQSSDIVAVDDSEVASAVRFIRARAHEPISVKDLLQEIPLSRRALERRFEKALGRMPKAEIMRVRIRRAQQLLGETDLSVTTIAQQSGFTGQNKFSEAFRRETGQTPGEYRRACRFDPESIQQQTAIKHRRARVKP
jgi:LacI family transcriptional regulator